VTGEARATGYAYRTVVHLLESAGVAATISSVDLTFLTGATAIAFSHHDQPISDTSNVCPANGTVDTRELMTTDVDASHPYATSVQVKVTFTDRSSAAGTASGSADVPSTGSPPPSQAYTLRGIISDGSTGRGIDGARLDVLTGSNAGKTSLTDNTGAYAIDGLVADSFRLRAMAAGYDPGEQGVSIPANPRADFTLQRSGSSCAYTLTTTESIVPPSGGMYAFSVTRDTHTGCSWTASTADTWITLTGATGGASPGTITYAIAANPVTTSRLGTITVAWSGGSSTFFVSQLPSRANCVPSRTIVLTPDAWEFYVDVGGGCYPGSRTSIDVPWIQLRSTHGGGQFLDLYITANTGAARAGHVTLADGSVVNSQITITQDAGQCVSAISPTSQRFTDGPGSGTVAVMTSGSCSWRALLNALWVTITEGKQGTGNGTVVFSVSSNPYLDVRFDTMDVGGLLFGISQDACGPVSVSPLEPVHIPTSGGTFTVTVSGPDRCTWSAGTADSFMSPSQVQRSGSSRVTFTVAANTTGQVRTAVAFVANRSIQVTQDP
jgi:hypothetical protein